MCVTLLQDVALSSTGIVMGAASGESGCRYIWYRNTVSPRSSGASAHLRMAPNLNSGAVRGAQGDLSNFDNCLVFSVYGPFQSIQAHETHGTDSALDDIVRVIDSKYEPLRPQAMSFGISRSTNSAVKIFITGSYTTIIAQEPEAIVTLLRQWNARAELIQTASVQTKLKQAAPGIPLALSLFCTNDVARAGLLLTFKPFEKFADFYICPTLDGHGELDFNADVEVDHTLAFGTDHANGYPVNYGLLPFGTAPIVRQCLPQRVLGLKLPKGWRLPNGDVWVDAASLRLGRLKALRVAPFGLTAKDSRLVGAPMDLSSFLPHPQSY
jgi:hypothetical protein